MSSFIHCLLLTAYSLHIVLPPSTTTTCPVISVVPRARNSTTSATSSGVAARVSDPVRAHEALARIRRLYDADVQAKPLDDAKRLLLRRTRSRPLLDALFAWLDGERDRVLPKSPMRVAIGYVLGNRAALSRYTEAGFLRIDNNASERALRAIAVGRKSCLFAGSNGGGRSAAVLYSVVGTFRRLGGDPFVCLRDAFARLPSLPPGRIGELLPDRSAAGTPGATP